MPHESHITYAVHREVIGTPEGEKPEAFEARMCWFYLSQVIRKAHLKHYRGDGRR